MNRIEQRLHDAAPAVGATQQTNPEAEIAQLLTAAPNHEQLLPGRADDAGKIRFRVGINALDDACRRPAWLGFILALLVAGTWLLTPGRAPENSAAPVAGAAAAKAGAREEAPGGSSAAPALWWHARLTRPWSAVDSGFAATVELPFGWTAVPQNASAEYPGLHADIFDQDLLPVAMLYFGPAPATDAGFQRCGLASQSGEDLDRRSIVTGAETLDPALAAAFSFTVAAGPEPRSTFGLVRAAAGDTPCVPDPLAAPAGGLLLRFGDELLLPGAAGGPGPRSGYARTFAARDDARRYLKSVEYATLRRMVTSLRFTLPADTSEIWTLGSSRSARLG